VPIRASTPEISVTEDGTVRMAAFGVASRITPFDAGTEPLPSSSHPPNEAHRRRDREDALSGAANGTRDRATPNGQDARASMPASSVAPLVGAPSVDRASSQVPPRRRAGGAMLGFGLGVLLMGMIMLLRSRSDPEATAPPPSVPSLGRDPVSAPEPMLTGAPASAPPASAPSAEQGSPASASAAEPARTAEAARAASSASPKAPSAKSSTKKKPSVLAATAAHAPKPGSSAKPPARPKPEAGRPKQELPMLLFE
jgi:hypothetical protein